MGMNRTFLSEQTDGYLHTTAGLSLYDIFPCKRRLDKPTFLCSSDRFDHRVDLLLP